MYIIIDKDYKITKSKVLTGAIRFLARNCEVSVIDVGNLKGMNSKEYQSELGEWSELEEFKVTL